MRESFNAVLHAARDEWADPTQAARWAADALLELTDDRWSNEGQAAVQLLREKRRDSALLLAVTEAGLWEDGRSARASLSIVREQLADAGWADPVADALTETEQTIHVLSLGEATLAILGSLSERAPALPLVQTHQAAVARGLGIFEVAVTVGPIDHADVMLLPVAARHGDRIWSTSTFIELAGAFTGTIVPVHHPLAQMSALNRRQFRPPATIVDVRFDARAS